MFKILQKTFSTGIATVNYPAEPARISEHFRGRPILTSRNGRMRDLLSKCAQLVPLPCLTQAIPGRSPSITAFAFSAVYAPRHRPDHAVRITQEFELATSQTAATWFLPRNTR